MTDYIYKLIQDVEFLTEKEEENWQRYTDFIYAHRINESPYKQKIFDYINQLGFIKREIEHKILEEYIKLENIDKHIGVF